MFSLEIVSVNLSNADLVAQYVLQEGIDLFAARELIFIMVLF